MRVETPPPQINFVLCSTFLRMSGFRFAYDSRCVNRYIDTYYSTKDSPVNYSFSGFVSQDLSNYSTHQQSSGKVMFSQVAVCPWEVDVGMLLASWDGSHGRG